MNSLIKIKTGEEKLDELTSYAYKSHYFNATYIIKIKQFKQIRSFRDFRNKAGTAMNLIRRNVIGRF